MRERGPLNVEKIEGGLGVQINSVILTKLKKIGVCKNIEGHNYDFFLLRYGV